MMSDLVPAFVTLFVIIDPIGLAPLFIALTAGMAAQKRRAIALRAVLIAFGLIALFGFAGETILDAIGIGMPAFRISGGVLLFLTSLDMLFERRKERREKTADAEIANDHDPSIFPIALPLLAGPGSLTTIILLMNEHQGDVPGQFMMLGVALFVLTIAYVLFLAAGMIERVLGQTGINVVTRVLGVLLAALSIQFILDGLRDVGLI
nr:MarC family protein [Rubricella aquisinus]